MADNGTTVLVTGNFWSTIGGQTRSYIAEIEKATGNATAWNAAANAEVSNVYVSGTNIFVRGGFTNIGGAARAGFAVLNSTTGLAEAFNPTFAGGGVIGFAVSGTTLYLTGEFTSIDGTTRNRAAAFDISGGTWTMTAWNPNLDAYAFDSILEGSDVYIGGGFVRTGGGTYNKLRLVKVDNTNGTTDNTFSFYLAGEARRVSKVGSYIAIGGNFVSSGGFRRKGFAVIDTTTGEPTSLTLNVGTGQQINSMAAEGGKLIVTGTLLGLGAAARTRQAVIDLQTETVDSWSVAANANQVEQVIPDRNTVYFAGDFTTNGGISRRKFAAASLITGAILPWNPNATGSGAVGNAIAIDKTRDVIYVGGNFTAIGGTARAGIAAVDRYSGALITSWDPGSNGRVLKMNIKDDVLYASGDFTTIASVSRSYLASFDITTGAITSWAPTVGSFIWQQVIAGNYMLISGPWSSGSAGKVRLAVIDLTTGNYTSMQKDFYSNYNGIAVNGTNVYLGGGNYLSTDLRHTFVIDINTGNLIP